MIIRTPPQIEKTEAVVLRTYPFSETSQVVVWFTREHGRIATLVKGALRPKSAFLGQYDLFYTCELLFYSQSKGDLHIIKEVTPLAMRTHLRSHWAAAACASYAADVIARTAPDHGPNLALFRTLGQVLDHAVVAKPVHLALFWFELRLLATLGLAPQLVACTRCHDQWNSQRTDFSLPAAVGGLVCHRCNSQRDQHEPLRPESVSLLRRIQRSTSILGLGGTIVEPRDLLSASRSLAAFMQYHLHDPLHSRTPATELAGIWEHGALRHTLNRK